MRKKMGRRKLRAERRLLETEADIRREAAWLKLEAMRAARAERLRARADRTRWTRLEDIPPLRPEDHAAIMERLQRRNLAMVRRMLAQVDCALDADGLPYRLESGPQTREDAGEDSSEEREARRQLAARLLGTGRVK